MQSAYQRRVDLAMWPVRELQASVWNVQLAKAGEKAIESPRFYALLTLDAPTKKGKTKAAAGAMSKKEYLAMLQKLSPPTGSDTPTP